MRKALFVLMVVLLGGPALAFGQQPRAPRAPAVTSPDLQPGELQRLFDAYVIVQAQDTLKLDEDQYGRFVSRLRELQETRRRNMVARAVIVQELARMVRGAGGSADESAIGSRLTQLEEHDVRAQAELHKAYQQLDDVLSVVQRAEYRVFEEQIERRKLDLLMRARQQLRQNRRNPQLDR